MASDLCVATGSGSRNVAAAGTPLAALSAEAATFSHLKTGCSRRALHDAAVCVAIDLRQVGLGISGGSSYLNTPVVFLPLLVTVARIHIV